MDPTKRFSNRVEQYVRFRPRYPQEIIAHLADACGLTSSSVVADIGSGTGISSEPFLANGNRVYGVEPNDDMRAAAEYLLAARQRGLNLNGCCERMGLWCWFGIRAIRAKHHSWPRMKSC